MNNSVTELVKLVDDRPIIIHSYFRAGSTAVCDSLAKHYNYKNFDEAFHNSFHLRRKKFLQYQGSNTDFVVKITGSCLSPKWEQLQESLWTRSLVVRLRRRDFLSQMVSWYISTVTDNWHETQNKQLEKYAVPLRKHDMVLAKLKMQSNNQIVDNCDRRIDVDLFYEDIAMPNTKFVYRKKPTNYKELVNFAQQIIESKP